MALPIVMPANNVQTAEELNIEFPGRVATLLAPGGWKSKPRDVPFALDNGRFSVWSRGKQWKAGDFRKHLDEAAEVGYDPLWVVVPDVVQDGPRTLEEWCRWYDRLKPYGWNLALAVQQGITPDIVKKLDNQPDVIFIGGGNTIWKWRYARQWCEEFRRVHIGAVGTERRLWMAQRCGAESSDSNVWRPIGQHLNRLRKYLRQSEEMGNSEMSKGFGLM